MVNLNADRSSTAVQISTMSFDAIMNTEFNCLQRHCMCSYGQELLSKIAGIEQVGRMIN